MKHRYYLIIFILLFLGITLIGGCIQQTPPSNVTIPQNNTTQPNFVTAKLVNVNGGAFVPSAGYYEGRLTLSDTTTGKEYSIFACSKNWDWVKNDYCYRFNPDDVNNNIEGHKYSMELNGCYVGTLEQVTC